MKLWELAKLKLREREYRALLYLSKGEANLQEVMEALGMSEAEPTEPSPPGAAGLGGEGQQAVPPGLCPGASSDPSRSGLPFGGEDRTQAQAGQGGEAQARKPRGRPRRGPPPPQGPPLLRRQEPPQAGPAPGRQGPRGPGPGRPGRQEVRPGPGAGGAGFLARRREVLGGVLGAEAVEEALAQAAKKAEKPFPYARKLLLAKPELTPELPEEELGYF